MFCRKCGQEVSDGAAFCNNCGANLNPVAAPVAAQGGNDKAINFINSILDIFKGFVTKGPKQLLDKSAKTTGFEWIVLAVISMLSCALGLTVNTNQLLGEDVVEMLSMIDVGFGTMFGINLLASMVSIFVPIGIVWFMLNIVFRAKVDFTTVANNCTIAFLPVSAIYIVNMLVGCIYAPLAFALLLVAIIYGFMLLNYSVEKSVASYSSDIVYAATSFTTIVLTVLTWVLLYKGVFEDALSSVGSFLF